MNNKICGFKFRRSFCVFAIIVIILISIVFSSVGANKIYLRLAKNSDGDMWCGGIIPPGYGGNGDEDDETDNTISVDDEGETDKNLWGGGDDDSSDADTVSNDEISDDNQHEEDEDNNEEDSEDQDPVDEGQDDSDLGEINPSEPDDESEEVDESLEEDTEDLEDDYDQQEENEERSDVISNEDEFIKENQEENGEATENQEGYNDISTSIQIEIDGELCELSDSDDDGAIDTFNCPSTGVKNLLGKTATGLFLIDNDDDGEWEYIYDASIGEVKIINANKDPSEASTSKDMFAVYLVASVGSVLVVLLAYWVYCDQKSLSNKTKEN